MLRKATAKVSRLLWSVRALKKLSYSIAKFIGSYFVVLGGVDAITFTAGIGENSWLVRKLVCERLSGALGVVLDEEKNMNVKSAMMISAPESKVKIFRIPTDEEMSIARQVVKTIER